MVGRNSISVPATPAHVRAFVVSNRQKYEGDLGKLQQLLTRLQRRERALRGVYKMYTRGDSQQGDELKSARKIRLKFNEHNQSKGLTEASLFDVPDIVGLTIVVSYPSDISQIAAVIDGAIERKELKAEQLGKSDPAATIVTKYGRAIESKGYFACHYNLRMPGVGSARPIIEVQIKTLLHDAWGAKTHDLTYKPTGRIGSELLTGFNLLGSNLANLDQQSDAMRQSIARTAAVRERKRRNIQTWVLLNNSRDNVAQVTDAELRDELISFHAKISAMTDDTADEDVLPIVNRLLEVFLTVDVAASSLLCFLAAMLQRPTYFEQAQETIAAREEVCTDDLDCVGIRFEGALAAFAAGDVGEAIDMAEETLEMASDLVAAGGGSDPARLNRILLGLNSDLGYYYADIIGSHDGDKRGAEARARSCIAASISLYPVIGIPGSGINSSDKEIIQALKNSGTAAQVFFSLDNEAYVAIQTATTEEELRAMRKRIDFLHQQVPAGLEHSAALASDYHDYCARVRLAELERGLLP